MFGSFVVSVLALLVGVLGCAWAKPVRPQHDETARAERRSRRHPALAPDDALSEH